jgi:hypothetical protein
MWKIARHFKESPAETPVSTPNADGLKKLLRGREIVEKLRQLKHRRALELRKISHIEEPRLPTRMKMGKITLNLISLT